MATNPYITEKQIERILQDVVDLFLIPHFERLGMNATGEWKGNVEVRGNEIWGRHYTEQLVYGRLPGKPPPIEPLKRWAMAKFGYGDKEALGMAFAVSKKIAKEGTTWYQKGGTDLVAILKSPQVIQFINERAGTIVRQSVTGALTNQLTKAFR